MLASAKNITIGADLRDTAGGEKVERLLEAFKELLEQQPDLQLSLAVKRRRGDYFSAFEWIDRAELWERIGFFPYYEVCQDFPLLKRSCTLWVDDSTPDAALNSHNLARQSKKGPMSQRRALFITSFHPAKPAGNTALMRQWLSHLKGAGYRVDLIYYATDKASLDKKAIARSKLDYDRLIEVPVETPIVGEHN